MLSVATCAFCNNLASAMQGEVNVILSDVMERRWLYGG